MLRGDEPRLVQVSLNAEFSVTSLKSSVCPPMQATNLVATIPCGTQNAITLVEFTAFVVDKLPWVDESRISSLLFDTHSIEATTATVSAMQATELLLYLALAGLEEDLAADIQDNLVCKLCGHKRPLGGFSLSHRAWPTFSLFYKLFYCV